MACSEYGHVRFLPATLLSFFLSITTTGEHLVAMLLRFFKKTFLGVGFYKRHVRKSHHMSPRERPRPANHTGMPVPRNKSDRTWLNTPMAQGVLGFWTATHPTKSRDTGPMVTLADLTSCWQIFRGMGEAKRFHLLLGSSISTEKSTRPG